MQRELHAVPVFNGKTDKRIPYFIVIIIIIIIYFDSNSFKTIQKHINK